MDSPQRHAIREEAIAHWSQEPAGALAAGETELGTPESFARVETHRREEQPWMHETFRFERFAGARVLEIGVGLGTDHVWLGRSGARLTGIDLTERCIGLTRRRLELEGLVSDLRVMDAERLHFPDHSFDVVYSFGVLHHVPSTERAFAEVRRVLRPGGAFVGALYSRESLFFTRWRLERLLTAGFMRESRDQWLARIEHGETGALPRVRLFGRRELRATLRDAGFQDVRIVRRHAAFGRYTSQLPAGLERALGRVAGWYLVHEAR